MRTIYAKHLEQYLAHMSIYFSCSYTLYADTELRLEDTVANKTDSASVPNPIIIQMNLKLQLITSEERVKVLREPITGTFELSMEVRMTSWR